MKAVILAGGLGTRLSEETEIKPKPMVQIGGMPILWHIMKIFSAANINSFIICCGYKGYVIKEYFANYFLHNSDVTFNLHENKMKVHQIAAEPWEVTLVDTGDATMTGGRLKRVGKYLGNETFCFTYGDGVADVDMQDILRFHREHGDLATVTAVQPIARFGALDLEGDRILRFREKSQADAGWINGGFMVLEPQVLDFIDGDETVFESDPLERLAAAKRLRAYKHGGFWHPMDTLWDKRYLERLWLERKSPWKIWK